MQSNEHTIVGDLLNPEVLVHPYKAVPILTETSRSISYLSTESFHPRIQSIIDSLIIYLHDNGIFTFFTDDTIATMRRRLQELTIETSLRLTAWSEIVFAAQKESISILLLKGPVVAEYYPPHIHRYQNDLDLLVHPQQSPDIGDFMARLGYVCPIEYVAPMRDPIHRRRPYLRFRTPNDSDGLFDYVDVHKDLQATWDPYTYDMNSIFARRTTEHLLGTTVSVPNPVDHMIYICTHAYNHYINSSYGVTDGQPLDRIRMGTDTDQMLRRLVDLWFFRHAHNITLDSCELARRSIAYNAQVAVEFCFKLLARLFKAI